MGSDSSSDLDSSLSHPPSRPPTSAATSPSTTGDSDHAKMGSMSNFATEHMLTEEKKARAENTRAEAKRLATLARSRRKKEELSHSERAQKAKELDELLRKSSVFSDILTQKTKALGRVGRNFDNQTLTDAGVELKKQPKIMTGGVMRDYQLEGLTWMFEIMLQGMSGILADEMGLGKTIQTISLVALLREQEAYYGPHLIIAPLSTLSNWQDEFQKWTPSIPFALYHGKPEERQAIYKNKINKNYKRKGTTGSALAGFPVVCTSYEMILRDHATLSKIDWACIIVDEGHRLKNADAKLFRELQQFKSASRFLITGTPLQNNLKELWSLLHFLMPETFLNWEAFEIWFDFTDLADEQGTQQFIGNRENQDLVKKIHKVLQPLLLRRIKADVANYLPKKREYVLYAPMTREQTDLYNVISDKGTDTRSYLENKVVERLTGATNTAVNSRRSSRQASLASSAVASEAPSPEASDASSPVGKRGRGRPKKNAFEAMMNGTASGSVAGRKRKSEVKVDFPEPKSTKSSRQSTPANSRRGRGRPKRGVTTYNVSDDLDEDKLDDDEFEAKLLAEMEAAQKQDDSDEYPQNEEEAIRAATLDLAKMQIKEKRLGNPLMQLRLVCNSPHNFYNPWNYDAELAIDESIVTSSGKMLLLDRLLPVLFERGHKVLIFSQFKTQLDILHDYCADLRKWKVCRIDGSVAQTDRREQIQNFNEDPDYKVFLLSTRAGGQGINLAAADTVILFDSDWNPQQDLQAQDRCHRIGQTRPVIIYRLATKGTVEEELLLSADAKRRLEKLVIKKGGFKSMGQKLDPHEEELDKETLRALLLKDGEVYQHSGGDRIFSDEDMDVLLDRSDDAYARAATGAGNADGFQVVDTAADGITQIKAA
ncbi:hypothetical protein PFICI_04528 [Pestalotiopsis fici W106-1]|uniref:Lymphoid-specific helicase n=1 Tax=Pestalotiopsis fici (strain W106-1 / CGMCC3.15140) TaxID=1229662 RepID=W3XB22_PESFW|nr:uncharacterized protein PFICI_04528 [Pestalotiopsis fici W106-1]ETS82652.1 hypothetical protein PFICI_04528 [Pestalotiopsis fici W106-1]